MTLRDEIEELNSELNSESELSIEDLMADLNSELKSEPKVKKHGNFEWNRPATMLSQWKATETILLIDVCICTSCTSVHRMPQGYFLAEVSRAQFSERRLTQIKSSRAAMPDVYKDLPIRTEEIVSEIGFCHQCYLLPETDDAPFHQPKESLA